MLMNHDLVASSAQFLKNVIFEERNGKLERPYLMHLQCMKTGIISYVVKRCSMMHNIMFQISMIEKPMTVFYAFPVRFIERTRQIYNTNARQYKENLYFSTFSDISFYLYVFLCDRKILQMANSYFTIIYQIILNVRFMTPITVRYKIELRFLQITGII